MTTRQINNTSKAKMIVTEHARQRAAERTNFSLRKEDLKKIALSARYKGVDINILKDSDMENKKLYNYLVNTFKHPNSTDKIRLFNNYIFIFCGENGRTLRTIVNLPENFS